MNYCKCVRLPVKTYLVIMHKKLKLLHFTTLSFLLSTNHTDLTILPSFITYFVFKKVSGKISSNPYSTFTSLKTL